LRRNTGALQRCLDGDRAQIMGGNGDRAPLNDPTGVRAALAITIELMMDFPVMYCEKLF
jgi:hypothetical protein